MATAAASSKDANHHARQHETDSNMHYPKGYLNAAQNTFMGVDETDALIWEQRYALPSALNYVSAVSAPPTEVGGDIYVLSDAVGTVHANWDGAAKGDWVRYNTAAALWYPITPLEGFTFYNKTDNTIYSFDGTTWNTTGGAGTVTSVSGTANRITSTGGATPVIDISATFEALLAKVAQRIDQNNAATTSAQLASIISDETGTGALVFAASPALTGNPTAPTQTVLDNSTKIATTAYVDASATWIKCPVKRNVTISHTGTTSETKIFSQLIPAGTFGANDIFYWFMQIGGTVNANNKVYKVYFNDSDDITSSPIQVATYALTNAGLIVMFDRHMIFKNAVGTQQIISTTTSIANYLTPSTSPHSTLAIDFTVDQYFCVSVALANSADTAYIHAIKSDIHR